MTFEKCIAQLKDLRQDREDFLDGEFMDDPYAADIEAIDTALAAIDDLLKARKLLRAAVEDINFYVDCYEAHCDECCCSQDNHCHWKHEAEALKLIGEDKNGT